MESWMWNIINAYDSNPYRHLVNRAKKAQEVDVIKCILLHQSETNTGQQNWPNLVEGIYQNLFAD